MKQAYFYTKQNFFINKTKNFFYILGKAPSFLVLVLIYIYQWTVSPDHGIFSIYTIGVCKFRPTCSEYTKTAIKEKGLIKGFGVGFSQIKKCH